DPRSGDDAPAALRDLRRERPREGRVVDDPGLGHEERAEAARVRLVLGDLLAAEPPEPAKAVGAPARLEIVEASKLLAARRENDLAASFVADPMLLAVPLERGPPFDAEPRLQRARLVVEARVGDAAVVACLVRRDRVLGFDHDDVGGECTNERAGGGEADD